MSSTRDRSKTRKLALGGILSGLTVVMLLLESIVPTGRLGFFVLASFILSVLLLESGFAWSAGAFVASSAVAFLIVPDKLGLIPFVLFFGLYPLVKNQIERRIRNLVLDFILKMAFFNAILWPALSLVERFLGYSLISTSSSAGYGLVALAEVCFIVYDQLFTMWIHYYLGKIAPKIPR